jgi:hypothetical protein
MFVHFQFVNIVRTFMSSDNLNCDFRFFSMLLNVNHSYFAVLFTFLVTVHSTILTVSVLFLIGSRRTAMAP